MELRQTCLIALVFALAFFLQGCADTSPTPAPTPPAPPVQPTPTPTLGPTPAPTPAAFECESDLMIPTETLSNLSQKGVAVDDTTFFGCTEKMPSEWPNVGSGSTIKNLRLFKSYRGSQDSEEVLSEIRKTFVAHVQANGIKVLVGTSITCSPEDDEKDWQQTKKLVEALGKEHVLGLAVGNELDQLQHHSELPDLQKCLEMIWGGYLYNQTARLAKEARELVDNPELPVTSVFTGEIIWTGLDTPGLGIRKYFAEVLGLKGKPKVENFVFTLNYYPYFDPSLQLDPDQVHCKGALATAGCFDSPTCLTILNLIQTRVYLKEITNAIDDRLWIGEIGWSSPEPADFKPVSRINTCKEFDSYATLYDYYKGFLSWDLTFTGAGSPPEIVFYFTMRDANNFGNDEHFGLIQDCNATSCKLTKEKVEANHSSTTMAPDTTAIAAALLV